MSTHRTEKDSMGEVMVPETAYWGAQTQRAIDNFPVSGITFAVPFIQSLAMIKKACAGVHRDLGLLDPKIADAIEHVCEEIIEGQHYDQFPLDIFQTGSGTSTNMNMNEVVATRANEILSGSKKTSSPVHPNDHVNRGQSSNDVIPAAIHVSAALQTKETFLPALEALHKAIVDKQRSFRNVVKTGRTHLMDAMPLTLEQEMSGWASQVVHAKERIESALPGLLELAVGGTAVGTGVNSPEGFGGRVADKLSKLTGTHFREAANHFEAQSSQDAVASLSGQLKSYASVLIKICNDLRWMNSGPNSGLGEIRVPSLQPGSSIMPGKVNPVIPEAARMADEQVFRNDAVISPSNAIGEFHLNVMLPVIAHNVLQSIRLLANVSRLLAEKTITGFEVDEQRIAELLERNPILATVLNPIIGYDKAAEVAKKAMREKKTIREVVVEMGYLTARQAEDILDPKKMTNPDAAKEGR